MDLFGRVFGRVLAVRLRLPFPLRNRDGSPGAGHPSTQTPQDGCSLHEAVRQGFILLSPVAAAIPVVGTVLSGCVNTLLAVWNGINKKKQNKEIAARLIKSLYDLQINMSAMGNSDDAGSVQDHRELVRKLVVISDRLKRLPVNSFLHNTRTTESILDCITEINTHLFHYMVLSNMRMGQNMERLLEMFSGNHERLPGSVKQRVVFVMDATGREFRVLTDQCRSRKQFITVLKCYFRNTEKDRVLLDFMDRGAYDLHIETESGIARLDGWSRIQAGTRVVMSAVFESYNARGRYKCPRCQAWNTNKEENDGWIDCIGCLGRFQITDTERNIQGSMTSFEGRRRLRLDLILNFHLKLRAAISRSQPVPIQYRQRRQQFRSQQERRHLYDPTFAPVIPH